MLILRTDSLYPCSNNLRIKIITIIPYPMNNGVNFFKTWGLQIILKWLHPRSRGLQPIRQCWLILIVTTPLVFRVRRRWGLVSYQAANRRARIPPSIMELGGTLYCTRRQEWLSASGNKSNSSKIWFGKSSNQASIEYKLGWSLVNRSDEVKHYKKKWK